MSSRDPLVSFVIPCYNYGHYLAECLASIFRQEACNDFEIIAVDDGSTDNTREVLRTNQDPRLRLIIHERNLGHIQSVNEGLAAARGAFIARIDPDDRYRPWFLASVLGKFREYPEVGLVYGDVALMDDCGTVNVERCDRTHQGADFKGNEFVPLLEENFICAPTTMARREAWHMVLPIPAGLAFNDWYLNVMMARTCEFYYIHRVLADYRVHPANHHTKISRDKTEEASVFWLLDQVYGHREDSKNLEQAKLYARKRVYAAQYLTLAEKYFGFHMNEDAMRCYWNAARNRPSCMLQSGVLRRFVATVVGREWYEAGKAILKRRASAHGG
jgi:glycosyltransferase involved in cell wall biosynthesis